MVDTKISLREIFNTYVEHNKLTISHVSQVTGIPYTNILEWSKNLRDISEKNRCKIIDFMEGDYIVSVDTVIHYLEIQQSEQN